VAIERRAATSNTIVTFFAAAFVHVGCVTVGIVGHFLAVCRNGPNVGVEVVVVYAIYTFVVVSHGTSVVCSTWSVAHTTH
jgi:hypothetical protein